MNTAIVDMAVINIDKVIDKLVDMAIDNCSSTECWVVTRCTLVVDTAIIEVLVEVDCYYHCS